MALKNRGWKKHVKKKEITRHELLTIKRMLSWPTQQPFPRCPARSIRTAQLLAEAGEPWHLKPGHVCEKCRCKKIAGYGTWRHDWIHGDFYGLGEHTGHHGVGFCFWHEQGTGRGSIAYQYAKAAMKALQISGEAPGPSGEWLRTLQMDAELSVDRINVRKGMETVAKTLRDFEAACHGNTCSLKEYSNGELQKMSDKSRIQLALQIAKTLSDITKDVVHLERCDYVHRDVIKIAVFRTIDATLKVLPKEDERKEWMMKFREIWQAVRNGG